MRKQTGDEDATYFSTIGKLISHNWTSAHLSMSKIKSDEAPVLSEFRDTRLKA